MTRRRTARELEAAAALRPPPGAPAEGPPSEPLRMLARRALRPRPAPPDLPFAPEDAATARQMATRLRHYAFRLFLRGAILSPGGFAPARATRYLGAAQARACAEDLVALGVAERLARGRYRLLRPARSFGGTLEWWLARELRERLGLDAEAGVRSGAPGVGGDLDVVAAGEGKLVYLEAKSSPPKHLTVAEIRAFLRRVRAVRPDVALFVVDTALRLSDKVLPMFAEALAREGAPALPPVRAFRETWALGAHLYLVNAREDLADNVCRAVAEGFRALAPPIVDPAPERGWAPPLLSRAGLDQYQLRSGTRSGRGRAATERESEVAHGTQVRRLPGDPERERLHAHHRGGGERAAPRGGDARRGRPRAQGLPRAP